MPKNSANSAAALTGNTTSQSPLNEKKQVDPVVKWCFTLHNYTNEDIENINFVCANSAKFYIFSEETGASDETPHLQGYIEFNKKLRPKNLFLNNTIHWEPAGRRCKNKKNIRMYNVEYIKKEGGKVYLNGRAIRQVKTITSLYPWQQQIVNICETEPDDRTIYWIWEKTGNRGKSALVKYILTKFNAISVSNKAGDMKYGIVKHNETNFVYPDIVLIDIPRSVNMDFLSYTGIEEIKNGCFFSTKYESSCIVMPNPHVFIFSNEGPDLRQLSKDRWKIIDL